MIRTMRRFAWSAAALAFFSIFFLSLDSADLFDMRTGLVACAKGAGAFVLVWLVAFVLSDILFKGVVEDLSLHDIDVLDEGLLQRVREVKENSRIDAKTESAKERAASR